MAYTIVEGTKAQRSQQCPMGNMADNKTSVCTYKEVVYDEIKETHSHGCKVNAAYNVLNVTK